MSYIFPKINFTNFTYNLSDGCSGPVAAYSATQTPCNKLQTIASCCDELSNSLSIGFDRCLNNSIYGCKAASNLTPEESQVVTGFFWFLIVIGGVAMVIIILAALYRFIKCCFCQRSEYRELA